MPDYTEKCLFFNLFLEKCRFLLLQYTPRRCFESFVRNINDAQREGDQNKDSTVVAETMKLIGNSSSGYQIMDGSPHTNTKFVKGSHVDKFINNKFFKSLNELPDQIYDVEFSKTRIEHKKTIIVDFLSSCTPNFQSYVLIKKSLTRRKNKWSPINHEAQEHNENSIIYPSG